MPDKPAIQLYKDKTVGWASRRQPVFGRDKDPSQDFLESPREPALLMNFNDAEFLNM